MYCRGSGGGKGELGRAETRTFVLHHHEFAYYAEFDIVRIVSCGTDHR